MPELVSPSELPPPHRIRWRDFTDGETYVLVHNKDFQQSPKQAAESGRLWGRRNNLQMSFEVYERQIYVTCLGPRTES